MATLNTKATLVIENQEYINKVDISTNTKNISSNLTKINTNITDIANLKQNSGITIIDANKSGLSWYRKYSDGWIEQGGRTPSLSDGQTTVTFPIEFKDTNYSILTTSVNSSENSTTSIAKSLTTKTAIVTYDVEDGSGTGTVQWYACGY